MSMASKRFAYIAAAVCLLMLSAVGIATAFTQSTFGKQTSFHAPSISDFQNDSDTPRRNVIMMISDGFGPASETYSRSYYQYINNLPFDHMMPLDTIHVGQSRTRSASSLVTDSAAGATAFSCAMKTYNGAIAVNVDKEPCGTVLESAKLHHDMLTGLVATSRITHATPASFSAHVVDRDMEDQIASQQIGDNPLGRTVDLLLGGGICHFLPNTIDTSCRSDDVDIWNVSTKKYGWTTVIQDRQEFDKLSTAADVLPLIGLFTPDHMSYEIDRNNDTEPSLREMSEKALDILKSATANSEKGFFLMIEGSRIDMAAHSNDAAAHLQDIYAYHDTVEMVKNFVDENPGTILISTSDHETGGFTLARQVSDAYPKYLWYPDVLSRVKNSTIVLANAIHSLKGSSNVEQKKLVAESIVTEGLGITDATDEEMEFLLSDPKRSALDHFLADMVSIRAQLGWTTHGHSGVDVNLYAYGVDSDLLRGNHENTNIGAFIEQFLDLNLTEITERLNKDNSSFHISAMTDAQKAVFTDHLDHYHHDDSKLNHPSH
ncbi:alkaline phosphatase [Umbelopsis sp. PMI_123]|nr:alkaline phosphatase [Umbelopsis sp. PMI_123]